VDHDDREIATAPAGVNSARPSSRHGRAQPPAARAVGEELVEALGACKPPPFVPRFATPSVKRTMSADSSFDAHFLYV